MNMHNADAEGLTITGPQIQEYLRIPDSAVDPARRMMFNALAVAVNRAYDPAAKVVVVGIDYRSSSAMVHQMEEWARQISEVTCPIRAVSMQADSERLFGIRDADLLWVEPDALHDAPIGFRALVHSIAPEKY